MRIGASNASAVLAIGLGTGTLPITPTCVLQNLPLSPILAPLTLSATGSADLPVQLPPLAPFDFYMQVAQVGAAQFSMTNPLRMRVQ